MKKFIGMIAVLILMMGCMVSTLERVQQVIKIDYSGSWSMFISAYPSVTYKGIGPAEIVFDIIPPSYKASIMKTSGVGTLSVSIIKRTTEYFHAMSNPPEDTIFQTFSTEERGLRFTVYN